MKTQQGEKDVTSQEAAGHRREAKMSRRRSIVTFVSVILVVVIVGGALYLARNNAENLRVGDCATSGNQSTLKKVACDSPGAELKVVGRVGGNRGRATSTACRAFSQVAEVYWQKSGKKGFVLCLAHHRT